MASLLLMVLTAIVVNVDLLDGQRLEGEFVELSEQGLTISLSNGQSRFFSRGGLRTARFPGSDDIQTAPVFVQLTDDSVVPCDSVLLADGKLAATRHANQWTAPEATVRAIRWPLANEKTDDQWNEIIDKAGTEDILVIRREQSLDYLKGVVLAVSEAAIQFEFSGTSIPVPLAKAAGVILARQTKTRAAPRLQLTTRDGGRWLLRSAVSNNRQLELLSMDGVRRSMSTEEIAEIQFPQLGAVFLTDLEPTAFEFEPFIGSQLDETIKRLNAPSANGSADGVTLRLADPRSATGWRSFRHGMSLTSRTRLVYRLAGKYQRFQATAGIDPLAPSQADAELKLFADEREIYSRSLRSADPISLIDVDVQGVRRLSILVDYGANMDIGDRVVLGDARLTK